MVTEERLCRTDVLEHSPGDVCALTYRAVGKSLPGRGSSGSKGTEALNSLQNHGIASRSTELKHGVPGLSMMRLGRESRQSKKAFTGVLIRRGS